jgi:hypothetical protein
MTISAAVVPGDDLDIRMGLEPGFNTGSLRVRQYIYDLPALEVTNHRAVSLPPLPSPVVDPDDGRCTRTLSPHACERS